MGKGHRSKGTCRAGCGRLPNTKLPLSAGYISLPLSTCYYSLVVFPDWEAHLSFVSRDFIGVLFYRHDCPIDELPVWLNSISRNLLSAVRYLIVSGGSS